MTSAVVLLLSVVAAPLSLPGSDPAPSLEEVRTRAENGDLEAQNTLGNAYTNALLGLGQDFGEALRWYRAAADKGFVPSLFNLGLAAELGRGMPKDEARAFRYYLMAAEQGFLAAVFNVGNMYASGRGVKQDVFEANLWYRQAAEKGLTEAQYNLALSYETGRGLKQDEGQAVRWYRLAADRGFALAQYNLGLMLEEGRGGPRDEATAAALYQAAAHQGVAAAQNNFGLMLYEGRGGLHRNPVEAAAWLELAVANGVPSHARDTVAAALTPSQMSEVRTRLAAMSAPIATPIPRSTTPTTAAVSTGSVSNTLPARVQPASVPSSRNQPPNQDLVEYNRLQRMKTTAAALNENSTTVKSRFGTTELDHEKVIASLKSDNDSLKAEIQRTTRELLWLKQQRETTSDEESAERVRAAEAEVGRLNRQVADLGAQLEQAQLRPPTNGESDSVISTLQAQNTALRRERDDLEKWIQTLEQAMQEKNQPTSTVPPTPTHIALEAQLLKVQQLSRENTDLAEKLSQAEARLTAQTSGNPDRMQADLSRRHILELEQKAVKLGQEKETLTNILVAEQGQAREAQEQADALSRELERLKQQFIKQGTALEELRAEQQRWHSSPPADAGHAQELALLKNTSAELMEAKAKLEAENRILRQSRGEETGKDSSAQLAALATQLQGARANARQLTTERDDLLKQNEQLRRGNAGSPRDSEPTDSRILQLEAQLALAQKDLDAALVRATAAEAGQPRLAAEPDLVRTNTILAQDLEDARRLLASYRADLSRLRQESQRALPAASPTDTTSDMQIAQLRRELDSARATQARQAESFIGQEREREATIGRLRTENSALTGRLTQLQGTLDQIAASMRLTSNSINRNPGGAPVITNPTPGPRYHTVAQGDSLSRISERYYGNASQWQEIFRANQGLLQGATTLRVGQRLLIP